MVYHNITPGHFFHAFDQEQARNLDKAREDLVRVGRAADAIWAVSEFNAKECREAGLESVSVFPLLFDPALFNESPDRPRRSPLKNGLKQVLFVGRLIPNKNVEELMLAFTQYHLRINPRSCLRIVGSEWSCPKYFAMLRMLCDELGHDKILFERYVPDAQLPDYYKAADLFVSTSEHEGFCLPLLEAMQQQVPVIAKHRGGMPEALGGAGILYDGLNACELAELMHMALSDSTTQQRILNSQNIRMKEYEGRNVELELRALLDQLG